MQGEEQPGVQLSAAPRVDSSLLSTINYNHSYSPLPGIVISLEALHQHLMPLNTFGTQHIILQMRGWKVAGRQQEECTVSLVLQEPRLAQHKTVAGPNPLDPLGGLARGPHTT